MQTFYFLLRKVFLVVARAEQLGGGSVEIEMRLERVGAKGEV